MAAYIKFDAYYKDRVAVSESIATMGRQLWDGIKHTFNTENWVDSDANNANYLAAKRKYFDELFTISPKLQSKLVSWIKQIPGVVALPPGDMNQMLKAQNVEQRSYVTTNQHLGTIGTSYDYRERNELSLQRKARSTNTRNRFSYATCSYVLNDGGKAYLLFFTFDSDGIDSCQVLCSNKYASGGMAANFTFEKVPQWNSVSKNEYMK